MAELRSAIFWVLCPKQSLHCYSPASKYFEALSTWVTTTQVWLQPITVRTYAKERAVGAIHELP
ncbi:MAG: hypothetical protein ACK6CP_19565, partial [Pseudanabaena sp.]